MHDKQLREEIVKRKLETGRSAQSLSEEYGIPKRTSSPLVWIGLLLTTAFCVLSKVLSNQYALLLGRE